MAEASEADIATYLTIDGKVFIAPQYNIAFDKAYGTGGSCPDFVALDHSCRNVVVVEISSANNISTLIESVRCRKTRWFDPLRIPLTEFCIVQNTWQFRFLGFVRQSNVARARIFFENDNDVAFYPIEDATFPWLYWDNRIENGLPGAIRVPQGA